MSNTFYPRAVRGLIWPVSKVPEFSTVVNGAENLSSTRVKQALNPRWHFDLTYEYLKDNPSDLVTALNGYTDFRYLQGFYNARRGRWDDFLFLDPTDNQVTNQPLQLVTDGSTWYSPIQRNFAGQFLEDVTDLYGSIALFENGSPASTAFTLGWGGLQLPGFTSQGLYVQWASMPTAPITATFQFLFRVRFDMDAQAFDQFMQYLWTSGGSFAKKADVLKLVSALPNTFGSVPGAGGWGYVPFPPFTPCGNNVAVLYPSQISLSYGSGPGTLTGYALAVGASGFLVRLNFQGLASAGGSAQFSNYPDPGISRSRICAVYSYIPFSHPATNTGNNGFAFSSAHVNGVGMIGGTLSTAIGNFFYNNGVLINLLQPPVTAFNINFSSIQQNVAEGHSIIGQYNSDMMGTVQVLVYYT